MPESRDAYRYDEMSGDWVAVVPGRRKAYEGRLPRPAVLPELDHRCPFCPGHEADTEVTIAAWPTPAGWQIRVVENLYPLVTANAVLPTLDGEARAPRGRHEVLIEHVEHDVDMPDFDAEHLAAVVRMYRDRAAAALGVEGVCTVSAFRNRGRRAGSSQPHPHGQVVALTVPSPRAARRQILADAHFREYGRTLLATQLAREVEQQVRMVDAVGEFHAFAPFAPRQNHHVRIATAAARGSFGQIDDRACEDLAAILGRVLRRIRRATNGAPYNVLFESPPVAATDGAAAFWFVDVLPRRGGGAGFELSSGMDVVTVTPEAAAAALRDADPS